MSVAHSIDPACFREEDLAQASPDVLLDMLTTFIDTLLPADADTGCGADYRSAPEEPINRRNGYRHRDFTIGSGTLDVEIPTVRQGTYFPKSLIERRSRAEPALTTVVGIFSGRDTISCLVGAVLAEQNDEWAESLSYLGLDALTKSQAVGTTESEQETTSNPALST